MADTTSATLSDFIQDAFELSAWYALRPQLYYDATADVKPTNQNMPGSSVTWTFVNDLTFITTSLNESTDVTATAAAQGTPVTLTLAEFGMSVVTTALGRGTSFVDFDEIIQNVVGYNAGGSIDTLAKNQLQAGSNVAYSQGSATSKPPGRSSVTPVNTFGAADVAAAVAALRRNNVPTINGTYMAFIHPDVQFDLMEQSTGSVWFLPHAYSAPDAIWNGEIGQFMGCRFIATPRAPLFADAGSSTTNTDVYGTLFQGKQALAKAWSYVDGNTEYPRIVPGPITDLLRRFVPIGWYWMGAYGRFREQSLYRYESASSIGNNAGTGSN